MSKIRLISDFHLGHANILKFAPMRGGTDVQSHSEWLVAQWNSTVHKTDVVWVLWDICFDKKHLKYLKQMHGQKVMLWGNHDKFPVTAYQPYFHQIFGFRKKWGFWVSHSPIHLCELRGRGNIHGHVHQNSVRKDDGELDERYVNVCVEALNGKPIAIDDVKVAFQMAQVKCRHVPSEK